jgi:non-ribosomal peptide synthetase component F
MEVIAWAQLVLWHCTVNTLPVMTKQPLWCLWGHLCMQVFPPLCVGGQVVLPQPGSQTDPEHLTELCSRMGVTYYSSVKSLMLMVVQHPGKLITDATIQLNTGRLDVLMRVPVLSLNMHI